MVIMEFHRTVSFIKSGFRIIGLLFLPFFVWTTVIFLVLAEVLGIVEEL
jgi:hypothetical protein